MPKRVTGYNPADVAEIELFLQQRVKHAQWVSYAALAGGGLLSLLGPMLVLLMYLIFSLGLITSYGFWGAYGIMAVITLPIFFGVALWLRGSVLEHFTADDGEIPGGFLFRGRIGAALVVLEIANIGPRLVLWGIDRMNGHRRISGSSLQRIALGLAVLRATDSGIPPAKLLNPGESADDLSPMLAFLLYYQMVDLSKSGDRVWLVSHVREEMARAKALRHTSASQIRGR